MKKFSIFYDPNNPNPLRGHGSSKLKEMKKQESEQRYYFDKQGMPSDEDFDRNEGQALINLDLSSEVHYIRESYPDEACEMIGLNDDIRFIDILVDLLNGCFDPSSLGQIDPVYQELIFIVLADTLYVKYIDIWNLRVNGTCSGLLRKVLVNEVTIIGDRDKK